MSQGSSGPPDHPGYIFVLMTDDTSSNASVLEHKTEQGFHLEGFWRDYAVFSWGYNSQNDQH